MKRKRNNTKEEQVSTSEDDSAEEEQPKASVLYKPLFTKEKRSNGCRICPLGFDSKNKKHRNKECMESIRARGRRPEKKGSKVSILPTPTNSPVQIN
jgi:hypothetical protein